MLNLTVAGRVVRDAELRSTNSGTDVLNFTVVTDVYDKGEKKGVFVNCSLFGSRAAKIEPYILKGTPMTVMGSATQDIYNDKPQLKLNVGDFALHGSKRDSGDEPDTPADAGADLDDEIPF